jgi:HPt (histidine-containing phosphotransfer) domain-containing protein
MNQKIIQSKIDLMGLDNYQLMLSVYEKETARSLQDMRNADKLRASLHSLKSTSYAIGLESLGNWLVELEGLIVNGALSTLHTHLNLLPKKVQEEVQAIKVYIAEL